MLSSVFPLIMLNSEITGIVGVRADNVPECSEINVVGDKLIFDKQTLFRHQL